MGQHIIENKDKNQKNSGFTLIELSIVLVIIGLIIGGVLIGQELIRGAEVRSMISQIDKLNASVNAFRNKYNGLPGDFVAATSYLTSTALTNGDGNGQIFSTSGAVSATPTAFGAALASPNNELQLVFYHLTLAGLIEGSFTYAAGTAYTVGTHIPAMKNNKGGIMAYGFTDYNNYWHMGAQTTTGAIIVTSDSLSPEAAYQIDAKMDDGVANTGVVQAKGGVVLEGAATAAAVGTSACTVTGGAIYNTANGQALLCQIRAKWL
jgi:prepilin-type N-terminal cleavage/methylation domain-containing protein